MKGIWAVPVIASILLIGTLGVNPNAFALCPPDCGSGNGIIVSLNPSENSRHGTIQRTDDNSDRLYQFRIPQDVGEDYLPSVGDPVCFDIEPANSRHATNVKHSSACSSSGGI